MAVPVLPVHPGACVIQMVPGTTRQPRLVEGRFLDVESGLVFDQEVRHLSVGDPDPHTPQQLGHLRLAHLRPIIEHQRQALEPRAKLAPVARRQGRHVGHVLRRGVKFLLPEPHMVGAEEHILHHHVCVALEHRIRRQARRINSHHLLPIDRDAVQLTAFRPRFRRATFLFRGEVLGGRLRRVGLDRGLALLALKPVDLVAQALDFRLGCPQLSSHVFQQVEQPPDEFACLFICDAGQVKVFEHSAARSSGETLRVLRASMPVFPPRGNLLQHGLSATDF